jgi:hypothetical protein
MSAVVARSGAFGVEIGLDVERTEIVFHNETPERVRIEITVRNLSEEVTPPTVAVLQAAPLGAFVTWRPLTILHVPALLPGEVITLETLARVPQVATLGPPERVPPAQLLTALGMDDENRPGRVVAGTLPADPFALLGQAQRHWAGNLNVFIGGKATERHLAQALRIYPGVVNMAMFVVGSGRDVYRFELRGIGANLLDMMQLASLALDGQGGRVPLEEWVPLDGRAVLLLAVRPPEDATAGTVEVVVTQRSTGHETVVEFSLDRTAAGPGCFVV